MTFPQRISEAFAEGGAAETVLDDIDCSANPNYPAAVKGDTYVVSVGGKVGGAAGPSVEIGDVVKAKADNDGGTHAAVGTSWFIVNKNIATLGSAALADTGDFDAAGAAAAAQAAAESYADAAVAAAPARLYNTYGAPTPILDRITTQPLRAGHHFYRLKASQDIAIEMYRVTGATVDDLGFVGPIVDVAQLAAFANGSDVRVSKIYMPDGTVYAEQADAAKMPLLWSGAQKCFASFGAETANGYDAFLGAAGGVCPALVFDGARYLSKVAALGLGSTNPALTVATVGAVSSNDKALWALGDSANAVGKVIIGYFSSTLTRMLMFDRNTGLVSRVVAGVDTAQHRYVWSRALASDMNAAVVRQDGVVLSGGTTGSGTPNLEDETFVFGASADGTNPMTATVQMPPFLWNSDLPVGSAAEFAIVQQWMKGAHYTAA